MDSNRRLHILVVEDEADVADTIALLLRTRMSADVDIVGDCERAREALAANDFDLVTIDFNLPDDSGIEFLEGYADDAKAPPMIIVTGRGGEEIAARSLRAGASGYVIKDASLPLALLHSAQHAVELSQAQKELAASRDLFQQMFDNMSSCVAIYRPVNGGEDFVLADFNEAAERVEHVKREDIVGRSLLDVFPGVKDFGLFDVLQRVSRTGHPEEFPAAEYRDERVTGWKENYVYRLSGGEIVAIYDDVTEEKESERALVASEAKYRFLADNMNDVVWTTDLELNLTYVSPSIEKVLGFTVEERMKQPLSEQLTQESLNLALVRMSNELEHDRGRDPDGADVLELYNYHENGGERCLETSLSFIRNEIGEPTGIYGLSRDVTERKLVEKALMQSEELFREMAEVSNDALVVLDSAGKITYWNPAAERIFGYSSNEVLGRQIAPLLSLPGEIEKYDAIVLEFGETGDVALPGRRFESRSMDKSGRVIPVEVSSAAFETEGEWKAVVNIRDITQRVKDQETIRRSAEELRDLVDLAAHELRHPATIFKGYSTMLLEYGTDLDSKVVKDALEAIDRGADRLADLIGKLLDTSRIGRIAVSMHMEGVDSEELVLGTVAKVLRRSERVINVKPGRVERDVVLDREKIAEVLTILLINAITHTAPQTEIDVSFEQVDSETVFSVADRGPGIPEDARERIFERFMQVEDVSHHSKPGIGLGLYIARTYVEAHNGWIKVEHRPGGGSIFSFAVPTTP